jgi:hypothetical protein
MTLREIAGAALIVVQGTVRPVKTYLSPDQCDLLTDYAITTEAVVAGTMPAPRAPGPQSVVVTQLGGTTVIDGVDVTVRDANLPPLPTNQRLILFLTPSSGDGSKYELVGTLAGAFRVDEHGRVSSLMSAGPAYAESIPVDRDVFISKLKSYRIKDEDLH